jgi:lysyl-tRNA synthetase, class II
MPRAVLDRLGLAYERGWGSGRMMKQVYDERVQHDVVGPVFCIDYPREVSPLARVHRADPDYVERFELIVAGFELCNAYSEQNDPVEQLAAFEAEARAKAGGDPEAGDVDLDYVRALEQGMPCTGGLGIGIDRLVMLLASVDSIREVILFPTLRPELGPPPDGGPRDAPRPLRPPTPVPSEALDGSVVALPDLAPSAHAVPPPPRSRPGGRAVRVIAALTALAGLLQLFTQIPVVHARLDPAQQAQIGPLAVPVAGHVTSVIVGLLLILLADELAKRKRPAFRVAVALFAVAGIAHLVKGPHPVAVAVCAAMLLALLWWRREFHAPGDPPSLLRLARFVPIYLVAVTGSGWPLSRSSRTGCTPTSPSVVRSRRCSPGSSGWTGRTATTRRSWPRSCRPLC